MSQIRALFTYVFVCLTLAASPAVAEKRERAVVVELFSSQNCGACPQANLNLIALGEEMNILPLTYSVDYWDYLGWADTFAKPEFAERQRAYAERFQLRGPYTPQTVYDGRRQCSGYKKAAMKNQIEATLASNETLADISFDVLASGEVAARIDLQTESPTDVWLIGFYKEQLDVLPTSGGNAGTTMHHRNVVNRLERLEWTGPETPVVFDCEEACAILVQEENGGAILGAGVYKSS